MLVPADAVKGDLRMIKTAKVLNTAMFALLTRNNFGKITVRDLCEEAQISRATFYARFADKFDFLKSWLPKLKPCGMDMENSEKTQELLNDFIYKNKTVIKNLICDADNETIEILSAFALSLFNLPEDYDLRQMNPNQIVLCNFYTGGLIKYFQWLAANRFPAEVNPINTHFLKIIHVFLEWARDIL